MGDWPKWADMNWLRLLEGPGDLVILPVAPTMKKLVYKGERYFRMPDARSGLRPDEDGTGLTSYGGTYLWDGWLPSMLRKPAPQEPGNPPAPVPRPVR